jgi:formylglycine-generating enzyme required for sulfatase activity
VPVGNVGNTYDPISFFGSVSYQYDIGKYDVTAGQYTEFLNAVAATDTYNLYNPGMASGFAPCGIVRIGASGSYVYTVSRQAADLPVNYVSYFDALRFANWIANGQPTGAQVAGTTETGSYTLTPTDVANNTVSRNAGATWVINNENEWYKAAYYNPAGANYYLYPTQSNTAPSNVLSAVGTNNANFLNGATYTHPTIYLTPVGSFAASPSAYGTFDQGGNVYQLTETTYGGISREIIGRYFGGGSNFLRSDNNSSTFANLENFNVGFRLVQLQAVPEPGTLGALSTSTIALLARRRRK